VQKRLDIATSRGAVATLRQITDESGKPSGPRPPLDVVIPANDLGAGQTVAVSPGLWVVEATLPSGELITTQVDVAPDEDVPVVLRASERSPREWLGWQYLLGNIESEATLELLQQRARKMAERAARKALGKSADPRFVERIAESVAHGVVYAWHLLATPVADALRFVTNGRFPSASAIIEEPAETDDAEVRLLAGGALSDDDADPWTALFSSDATGTPRSPTMVAADITTSVYEFGRPVPRGLDQPINLLPREFVSVTWRKERYAISLPLPWPALEGATGAAAQIMVRRLPVEQRLRIGVAVLDPAFGPLSGFMTAATLPKAAIMVEQAYGLLFDKTRNPLAAAAAGYVLIATGDDGKRDWHEWIGNLERLFPGLPDAAVLRGSLLLRHARGQAEISQARDAFLDAADRGIPYFSTGVSWLLDGLMVFSGEVEVDERLARVQRVARRLDLSQAFTVIRLSEQQKSRPRQASPDISQSTSVAPQNGDSTAMQKSEVDLSDVVPTTFSTIDLQPEAVASLDFTQFVNTLLDQLRTVKDERFAYYEELRQKNSRWANHSRQWLALLGSLAFLLTAIAAALRFTGWVLETDKYFLLAVLAIYAIMGTISFYEKGTTKTSDYFRHLSVILSIRDIWTKLQFALLGEAMALKKADDKIAAEPAARARMVALAEAFCNDLNKVSTSELSDWRAAFSSSLTELSEAAKKGSDDVAKQLQNAVKAAEKSATDAKAAAETAAKAAVEAGKTGSVNITISGEFDGEVVVFTDDVEKARSYGKSIAVGDIPPGIRKFAAQVQNGPRRLEASQMVEIKPGLQNLTLALT
jgi:hypothetical protein